MAISNPPSPPDPRQMTTVGQVCEEYLDRELASQRRQHWAEFRGVVAKFIAEKGCVALTDLMASDIEKWIDDRQEWKSTWTRKRILQTLKRCFSWALKKCLISRLPFNDTDRQSRGPAQAMSQEHYRMLLRGASPGFRRMLLFLWLTGARSSEMARLQWQHLDLKSGFAVLHSHKQAHGHRGPRIIYLPAKAIRLLAWMQRNQREGSDYVFLNTRGQPWNRVSMGLRMHQMRKRLGVPNGVGLHGIRHSFASRLYEAGVAPFLIAKLLGISTFRLGPQHALFSSDTEKVRSELEKGLAHKPGNKDAAEAGKRASHKNGKGE
jgi:integrase